MKNFRYIFALFFLFNFDGVVATDVDLELTSDIDFVDVEFGQVGEFSLSVTNHGPNTAGSPASRVIASTYVLVPAGQPIEIEFTKNDDISQTCNFSHFNGDPMVSGDAYDLISFIFPEILSGETISCYGKFKIRFSKGVRTIEWAVRSRNDNEINPGNETAQQVFSIAQAVPAIGFYALLTLLLATLLLARFRLSRENLR